MLIVENVSKKSNLVSANYYYQDKNDQGYVELDLKTKKVLKSIPNKEDELNDGGSIGKVFRFMRMMIDADNYPSPATYMWY